MRPRWDGVGLATSAITLFGALGSGFSGPSPDGAPPSPRPRLVLVLSIDQMRYDYLVRFAPLFKGGLKALLDQGAIFTNARYRHACTETGPGHSVILSGRSPSHSGIVANSWYDPVSKARVNVVDDPVQAPVGGEGRGASPANFLGFTLGDVLKKTSPTSRVVGVSLKDRAAILMAGRRADAAYWYETNGGAVHHEHLLHEGGARLARGLEREAHRRCVCRATVDASAPGPEPLREIRGPRRRRRRI
ncbi:MAG: alkaline phosphatase family protein [Vicinamibacteria bacterium]